MSDVVASTATFYGAGTLLLRVVLVGALVLAVRRRNLSVGANAAIALVATFLPVVLEVSLAAVYGVRVSVGGLVPFWIATAGFLHVLGMVGWYESRWWWDHVTHVVSAALLAAAVYGSVHGIALASPGPGSSPWTAATVTVLLTVAAGVFWELVELLVHRYSRRLGVESVLIPYGPRDTALDLVFDAVGALLVVAFDVRLLVPVAATVPFLTRAALVAVAGLLVVGSVASALLLLVGSSAARDP